MTPEEHAAATDELIAAWLAWDAACQRLSAVAQAHADRQAHKPIADRRPPPRPSAYALDAEVRRLSAAETVLGMPLGYTAAIAALRWLPDGRPGMSVSDAVETVVLELVGPVAPVDQLPTPSEHRRAS